MGRGFEDLLVWQKARVLAGVVYRLSSESALSRDFGLRDQMRRAAVSIASNIAEGHDRESGQDTIRFFFIAKASSAELITQAHIAHDVGYLIDIEAKKLIEDIDEVARMLRGLIRARQS